MTLRLRFRTLPLPPPATLRLPTTASCSRLRLPRFSLRPSRLRSALAACRCRSQYRLQHLTTGDICIHSATDLHPYLVTQGFDDLTEEQKKELIPQAKPVDPGSRIRCIQDVRPGQYMWLLPSAWIEVVEFEDLVPAVVTVTGGDPKNSKDKPKMYSISQAFHDKYVKDVTPPTWKEHLKTLRQKEHDPPPKKGVAARMRSAPTGKALRGSKQEPMPHGHPLRLRRRRPDGENAVSES